MPREAQRALASSATRLTNEFLFVILLPGSPKKSQIFFSPLPEIPYCLSRWSILLVEMEHRSFPDLPIDILAADKLLVSARHECLAKLAQGTVCPPRVKPHKVRYYPERRDPEFEQKMAQVLCVYRGVEILSLISAGSNSGQPRASR
jgi:hypothetical protein